VFKRIAEIVGFLATCAGLYVWFTAPTTGLEADVYFADFELPPNITQQFRGLAPLTNATESRPLFFSKGLRDKILPGGGDQIDQMLSRVANFANEKAPAILHTSDFAFKGYWRVAVRNKGAKSASSVVLHLPVPASGNVVRSHVDQAPPAWLENAGSKTRWSRPGSPATCARPAIPRKTGPPPSPSSGGGAAT